MTTSPSSAHPTTVPLAISPIVAAPLLTYLQWTTMGPACEGLSVFTFFRNFNMPMGVKGTPKSGQLVKCSCETSRGALQLSGSCCKG